MFRIEVTENHNAQFSFNNFAHPGGRAVYEIMRKKYGTARKATDENIILRMRFTCWMTKVMNTHSEYVILLLHGKNSYAKPPHPQFVCLFYYNCLRLHVVITQLLRGRETF